MPAISRMGNPYASRMAMGLSGKMRIFLSGLQLVGSGMMMEDGLYPLTEGRVSASGKSESCHG